MSKMKLLAFALHVCLCVWRGFAGVNDIATPDGVCLRTTASGVNVRSTACGTVVGQVNLGQYYTALGGQQRCTLSGASYDFHEFQYTSSAAWCSGDYLSIDRTSNCETVVAPTSEWRGAWIATVANIDWPTSSSSTPSVQQQQAVQYLDLLSSLNFNAVIFQVRPVGDAFYASAIEPWSRYLTGTQGKAPNPLWDPLEFWCTEAHSRGIEVHAWLNPYRANMSPSTSGLASNHMAIQFPQYAYPYGNYLWMDPGAPEIVQRLKDVIEDIVRRYDVDGIHFDDYFYPYPVSGVDFPDDATYADYRSQGGSLSIADWRRNNVNTMVESVWNLIQSLNTELRKSVKFSISPFGLYRPGHPDGQPPPLTGLDPYTSLYADSKHWVEQGWMDFIVPQIYWAIDPPQQSYSTLSVWWADLCQLAGIQFYAGNGAYKLEAANGDWPASEIGRQIDVSRVLRDRSSLGNCMYSFSQILDNAKGVQTIFREVYSNKASTPYSINKKK